MEGLFCSPSPYLSVPIRFRPYQRKHNSSWTDSLQGSWRRDAGRLLPVALFSQRLAEQMTRLRNSWTTLPSPVCSLVSSSHSCRSDLRFPLLEGKVSLFLKFFMIRWFIETQSFLQEDFTEDLRHRIYSLSLWTKELQQLIRYNHRGCNKPSLSLIFTIIIHIFLQHAWQTRQRFIINTGNY